MRWVALLVLLLLVIPAAADVDWFDIHTVYSSPTDYQIDWSANKTAYVYNYSLNSTVTLVNNQSWILAGSSGNSTIYELDARANIAFTADSYQNFTVATPGYYRYYYLVLQDGFYNAAGVFNLTMYSIVNTTTPLPGSPSLMIMNKGMDNDNSIAGALFGFMGGIIGGILIARLKR